MTDRRSQIRLLDDELVFVTWQEGETRFSQLANVNNMTLEGVGLIMDQELPVGTPVTLSYGHRELTGIVKHQSRKAFGQFIGVEFTETSKDSALHFDPDLLISYVYLD